MATRYHISDGGTPAVCRAKSVENCPKTKAGDGFHGDLEAATAESERRFEDSYGTTVTLSSKEKKHEWNKVAAQLKRDSLKKLWAGESLEDTQKWISDGLAKIHGVPSGNATVDGDHYLVEDQDGSRRVYGEKLNGRKLELNYLGVLHPKLGSMVAEGSEHKALAMDGQEATMDQWNLRSTQWYGYSTATVDGKEVTFPVDMDRLPVDRQVWEDMDSSKVPRVLFEDGQLRAAIANGGLIKD